MPVSRKRKKPHKKNSARKPSTINTNGHTPTHITSFADLRPQAATALSAVKTEDLDSFGLACFYIAFAPNDELNQCLMASGSLFLARQMLGCASEVAPVVLQIPDANEQWGRPQPERNSDGTLNGHVVLVTDKGILIDVTAGQFHSLGAKRDGLPIIVRNPQIWDHVCSPEAMKDQSRTCTVGVMSNPTEQLATYNVYSPMLASGVMGEFFHQGGEELAMYLHNFVTQFVWLVANKILVGPRAQEIARLDSPRFQSLVRQAVNTPPPEIQTP